MTEAEAMAVVAEVAREKLGWSGDLRPEMRLIEDLELDSIRLLELAVEIENRLRIRLDEEEEKDEVTPPAGVVLESAILSAAKTVLKASPFDIFQNYQKIGSVTAQVALIHGTADR